MDSIDNTTFPDRAECFGLFDLTNTTCTAPTSTMINFLNITDYNIYKKIYCLNPPQDSCAFGFCPNPDIGSPAVRIATYIQTLCFAILVYYSPDGITGALYAQMLSSYSLMLSAITAAITKQLSVFHALIVLSYIGSPLALFLSIYAIRGIFGKANRMDVIFGPGKILNRTLVLGLLPLWFAGVGIVADSRSAGWFQQGACIKMNFGSTSVLAFMNLYALWPAVLVAWIISLCFRRLLISTKESRWFPIVVKWNNIAEYYPFIHFTITVIIPMTWWIVVLELDAAYLHEYFTPTQGQILAIFAAVPATVQAALLVPRMLRWFMGLSWVLFITRRPQRASKALDRVSTSQYDSTAAFEHPLAMPSPGLETHSLHKMPSPVIPESNDC
ncbi:hypothetical protein BD410DRAFT_787957 [Rickenella mellea]|uniref:Uncharacterized protein n=1 Tax=Rickenella mellea TaxID=50990 RepID=A0A4Y7PRB7_9AGAM|nr:hypothetical protein BD410DRAFT_901056 [Rickenella mellea]TDL23118.1 hypothetical protein BD410DRAFT_787957 [Rickenella mellea]